MAGFFAHGILLVLGIFHPFRIAIPIAAHFVHCLPIHSVLVAVPHRGTPNMAAGRVVTYHFLDAPRNFGIECTRPFGETETLTHN